MYVINDQGDTLLLHARCAHAQSKCVTIAPPRGRRPIGELKRINARPFLRSYQYSNEAERR